MARFTLRQIQSLSVEANRQSGIVGDLVPGTLILVGGWWLIEDLDGRVVCALPSGQFEIAERLRKYLNDHELF